MRTGPRIAPSKKHQVIFVAPEVVVYQTGEKSIGAGIVGAPAVGGNARPFHIAFGNEITIFIDTLNTAAAIGVQGHEDELCFWRQPGVLRSTHPAGSFAAVGPHAERICAPQPLEPPHGHDSPVGRVYDLGGQVLLLGVTHGESTTLHLAEALAGVPYSVAAPCVVEEDGVVGSVMIAEPNHCCRGFVIADEWLRAGDLQREGPVGNAHARLAQSRDLVAQATAHLAEDLLLFLCAPGADCDECPTARASVPA